MESLSITIVQAVENLGWKFMTLGNYEESIKNGTLVDAKTDEDDIKFALKNPEHPLAMENKLKRINAADVLKGCQKELPQTVIDIIHRHIFDCCADVRLSLLEVLLCSGNQTSVPFIERLIITETESPKVKRLAEIVLNAVKFNHGYLSTGPLFYVGEIKGTRANGLGKMYYDETKKLVYEGGFKKDKFHGKGTYYNEDSSILCQGDFFHGKFLG